MSDNPADFATTFTEWWPASNLPLIHEPAARDAWDAGVRAAVITLHKETERLVAQASYEQAALVRDLRERCDRLFLSPHTWDHIKQMRHETYVRRLADLRKETTEELQRRLTLAEINLSWVRDIQKILKERGIDID